MDSIADDYFIHGIPPACQTNARLLLATTGLLNTVSGNYKLYITSTKVENQGWLTCDNIQTFVMTAAIIDSDNQVIEKLEAIGSPYQCYNYLTLSFESFLKPLNDEIYLKLHTSSDLEKRINDEFDC